ncbi:hypothetical protein [Altererythrobacter sp. MTPC7]|uniref:hypothetical protein n=1 Tax=Altererythrobacter sp. MTPC7 TaxID=3056567 RepID=UPI0036F24332
MIRALKAGAMFIVGVAALYSNFTLLSAFGGVAFSHDFILDSRTQSKIATQSYAAALADPEKAKAGCADAKIAKMARTGIIFEPLYGKAIAAATLVNGCHNGGLSLSPEIVAKTIVLNRRTLVLQAMQLQAQAKTRDIQGALATIERMVIIHPDVSDQFVPVLANSLAQTDDVAQLAQIMDGHPEWMSALIRYSAANLDPLHVVQVRKSFLDEPNENLVNADRDAVALLAARGFLPSAWAVYQMSKHFESRSKNELLASDGKVLPFGWNIPNSSQVRARLSPQRDVLMRADLRLAASGPLATQVFSVKEGLFKILIDAEIPDGFQMEAKIRCADDKSKGGWLKIEHNAVVDISGSLSGCRFAALRLHLRSLKKDRRSSILVRSFRFEEL